MRITDVQIHDVEHVTAHGVSVDEIEQALFNKPVIKRNRKDQKATYLAKGTAARRSSSRLICTERQPGYSPLGG